MANHSSQYRDDIIKLFSEGKKYYEIEVILGCSRAIVCYHLSRKQQNTAKIGRKRIDEARKISKKTGIFRNRKYVDDYLKEHPCIDCGNSDIRVLEFDHVRGDKLGHISHAVKCAWKLTKLKEEIDKCEVRCCNCHRIKTIERRNLHK